MIKEKKYLGLFAQPYQFKRNHNKAKVLSTVTVEDVDKDMQHKISRPFPRLTITALIRNSCVAICRNSYFLCQRMLSAIASKSAEILGSPFIPSICCKYSYTII